MTTKTEAPAKTFYATRNFKDAGTGKAFSFADKIDATEGEIGNYAAAGLASTDKPKLSAAEQLVADANAA